LDRLAKSVGHDSFATLGEHSDQLSAKASKDWLAGLDGRRAVNQILGRL
jgi:hypothetical protein